MLTARRIFTILRAESRAAALAVASKTADSAEVRLVEKRLGEPLAGAIPIDEAVAVAERAGVAPIDRTPCSPAVEAVEALADRLATADRRVGSRVA